METIDALPAALGLRRAARWFEGRAEQVRGEGAGQPVEWRAWWKAEGEAMKKKFTISRDNFGFATAIRYGKQWVLHLIAGTELNEHYVRWIVGRLNGKNSEPPEKPAQWRSKKL